ncbi:hypothetical protein F0562_034560 [Nyssa sinensis]|uniref:Exocyst subunit Exo70 family protein n=1 Tax=Nyssa sinensis TaxID=561372 RepID=A0A5J5AK53_9ASTE|nr:hypothetical protein F0562_034560 [Nyssa sinensis]
MEKNDPEKSGRNELKKNDVGSPTPRTPPNLSTIDEKSHRDHPQLQPQQTGDHIITTLSNVDDSCFSDQDHNIDQVSQDIDQFTDRLTTVDHKSNPPQVPDVVETFSKIVESRIAKYYSGGQNRMKFTSKMTEEESFFLEAVRRMSKLINAFSEFQSSSGSGSTTNSSLNRTSMVLQKAMSFLEEELRALLEDSRTSLAHLEGLCTKQSSFNSMRDDSDRCAFPPSELRRDEEGDYPAYSPEVVTKMSRIAAAMISAGYESESCQVYSIARRNAFVEALKNLEFDKISVDDVQKMQWEALEGEIAKWIKVVKHCATVLFPAERKLCEEVFSGNPSTSRSLFTNLARAVVVRFLDFAEAIALTRRSAEKLFKFLDMYETLRDLSSAIAQDDSGHDLKSEISAASDRIGEAAVNIFCDLENSIESDVAKNPVPGGAVHPLTRYVMNYLKYACEYKDTLEQIFQQNKKVEQQSVTTEEEEGGLAISSPFSVQLIAVMNLLDENLEAKSNLYKDPSLRDVFLMNNGRYILQKIKGSTEIHQLIGDTWCRRRSSELRQYHKNYQRETWGKVLQCLKHEGLQVNGKVCKAVLKERFKNFNTMFDEIHKTQATWVMSDEQLQSELRVSVTAVVIPAYRSFLGRFRQYLDSGRSAEKYIKYQAEDIETLIEELFDGNPTSMDGILL